MSVSDLAIFGFSVISGVAALDYVSIVTETSAFVQIMGWPAPIMPERASGQPITDILNRAQGHGAMTAGIGDK